MDFNVCRLCNSSNVKLTSSVDDAQIVKFLSLIKFNLSSSGPSQVCQLCIGKSQICINFINKIIETQNLLQSSLHPAPSKVLLKSSDILSNFKKNSGLTIKKVSGSSTSTKAQSNEEVIIYSDNESNPEDTFEEEISESDLFLDENTQMSSQSASSNDIFAVVDDESDYEPPTQKLKSKTLVTNSFNKPRKESLVLEAPCTFTCAKCKATFDSFDDLTDHIKNKVCESDIHTCEVCLKEFPTKQRLRHHAYTHRPRQKVMCEACGKEFKSQVDLDNHIESVHRRVVKSDCVYRCSHCHENFYSHLDLLEHVKQHLAEQKQAPKLCEICAKVCNNSRAYQTHMLIHKERKHVCQVCQKGFIHRTMLVEHMHVHTGIKSFVCKVPGCSRSYAKQESLRVHRRRDHPEESAVAGKKLKTN